MSIRTWNPNPGPPGAFDEHFWHATSLANAQAIRNAAVIDPARGTGANGRGFYVCTRKTDYQKAMALRNDASPHQYLYLLRVRVTNFWRLRPFFSEGFSGEGSEGERADVIIATWGPDNTGGCGNKHPNGNYACYEEYRSAQLVTPSWDLPLITRDTRARIVRVSGRHPPYIGTSALRDRTDPWNEMWRLANLPMPPIAGLMSLCPALFELVNTMVDRGVDRSEAMRAGLLSCMEELAFKAQGDPISVGSRICVVGAQRFGKTDRDFDAEEDIDLDAVPW